MATKAKVIDELRGKNLTWVIVCKPTAADVDFWEEEVAEIATSIKADAVAGGQLNGHLAYIIPEDEIWLELQDLGFDNWNDWEFEEQKNHLTLNYKAPKLMPQSKN